MGDEDAEAFELELQALQSVYFGDDVRLLRDDANGRVTEIVVTVRPSTCEDVEKQYLSIEIVFTIPPKYPTVLPAISFRNPRGLGEDETDSLSRNLESIAVDLIGSEMLLPLIDAVKDCLTTHNTKPHGQCCICLEDFAPDEGITRTLCAHCFHSHCLADYVAHAIKELTSSVDPKTKAPVVFTETTAFPCPICREAMQPLDFKHLRKQAPPVVKPSPEIDIHSETLRLQQAEFFNQLRLAREARQAEEAKKVADEAAIAIAAILRPTLPNVDSAPENAKESAEAPKNLPVENKVNDSSKNAHSGLNSNYSQSNRSHYSHNSRGYHGEYRDNKQYYERQNYNHHFERDSADKNAQQQSQHENSIDHSRRQPNMDNRNYGGNYYHPPHRQGQQQPFRRNNEDPAQYSDNARTLNPSSDQAFIGSKEQTNSGQPSRLPPGFEPKVVPPASSGDSRNRPPPPNRSYYHRNSDHVGRSHEQQQQLQRHSASHQSGNRNKVSSSNK